MLRSIIRAIAVGGAPAVGGALTLHYGGSSGGDAGARAPRCAPAAPAPPATAAASHPGGGMGAEDDGLMPAWRREKQASGGTVRPKLLRATTVRPAAPSAAAAEAERKSTHAQRLRSYKSSRAALDRRRELEKARASRFRVYRARDDSARQTLERQQTRLKTARLEEALAHNNVCFGSASRIGVRDSMEDTDVHTCAVVDGRPCLYFGVYDGHGGQRTSRLLAGALHRHIFDALDDFAAQEELGSDGDGHDPVRAILSGCQRADAQVLGDELDDLSGSTAVFLMLSGRSLHLGCVGDSQAVLAHDGGAALNLCAIHKPDDRGERERIERAGAFVENGRVIGLLGISRAFGDRDFKRPQHGPYGGGWQGGRSGSSDGRATTRHGSGGGGGGAGGTATAEFRPGELGAADAGTSTALQLGGGANHAFGGDVVTAVPDVVQRRVSHRDEFIVLGCDGLFDVMTPQDVVDFVRPRLARLRASRSGDGGDEGSAGAGGAPGGDCSAVGINEIAKQLVDQAIDVLGSMDNVSVIIVELHADGKRDDEG